MEREPTPFHEIEDAKQDSSKKISRRKFLKNIGLAGAGIAIGATAANELRRFTIQTQEKNKITTPEGLVPFYEEIKNNCHKIDKILKQNWLDRAQESDQRSDISLLKLIDNINKDTLSPADKQRLFEIPTPPVSSLNIEGFEKIGTDKNQTIAKRIRELLPPNIIGSTYRINYIDDDTGITNVGDAANSSGQHTIEVHSGLERVWQDFGWVEQGILVHEFGHNADWARNPLLSSPERIEFFYQVLNRTVSPDRLKSTTDIDPNKISNPVKIIDRVYEYWTEIFELYFTGRIAHIHYFEKESPTELTKGDQEIIEWLLARTDPEWLRTRGINYPKVHLE